MKQKAHLFRVNGGTVPSFTSLISFFLVDYLKHLFEFIK